eukprot:SAG31_NODE_2843_length_5012_cov_2.267454_4_plen_102_part_00
MLLSRFRATIREIRDVNREKYGTNRECVALQDPSIRTGDWSKEEDDKLDALVKEHGTSWTRIGSLLPGDGRRTRDQCRNHWHAKQRGVTVGAGRTSKKSRT